MHFAIILPWFMCSCFSSVHTPEFTFIKQASPQHFFFARLLGMKTDCPVENSPLSAAHYFQLIFPTVDDWRCHENNNLL